MNPLTDVLPAKVRKWLYALFALVGVVFGAVQLVASPDWLDPSLKVYAYLAPVLGFTAASNTGTPDPPPE